MQRLGRRHAAVSHAVRRGIHALTRPEASVTRVHSPSIGDAHAPGKEPPNQLGSGMKGGLHSPVMR
jgi:hypothetical protein